MSNKKNKKRFIAAFGKVLEHHDRSVRYSANDADTNIAKTALNSENG